MVQEVPMKQLHGRKENEDDGDPKGNKRIVLVNTDLPLSSAGVLAHVINKLKKKSI